MADKHLLRVWETSTSSSIQPVLKLLHLQHVRTQCLRIPALNNLAYFIHAIHGIDRRLWRQLLHSTMRDSGPKDPSQTQLNWRYYFPEQQSLEIEK